MFCSFMDICFDIETISHFFLQSPLFSVERWTLLNIINETDSVILHKSESFLTCVLLYDNEYFIGEINLLIWNTTTDFEFFTKRIVEQFISSSLILFLIIAVQKFSFSNLRPPAADISGVTLMSVWFLNLSATGQYFIDFLIAYIF